MPLPHFVPTVLPLLELDSDRENEVVLPANLEAPDQSLVYRIGQRLLGILLIYQHLLRLFTAQLEPFDEMRKWMVRWYIVNGGQTCVVSGLHIIYRQLSLLLVESCVHH